MTLIQKTKPTNRKFYNKWLYKTSFKIKGCSVLRTSSLEEVKLFCLGTDPEPSKYYVSWKQAWTNKESLYKMCDFLTEHDKDIYSLRIERDMLDVYTNDQEFYDKISLHCQDNLIHRFQPNANSIEVLNNGKNCITVDKLPKGRYNYRVYLLPHKFKGDKDEKTRYIKWLKSQNPKITCTSAIEKWILNTDWNWDRRYVLVEDDATLLMLKLRNAEVVGRVYNFVVCDK